MVKKSRGFASAMHHFGMGENGLGGYSVWMKSHRGSVLGGALLVAGTAIGGGMLALPVLTAMGGFLPALFIYFLCAIFMAGTGILLVDVLLWSPREVNLISMAEMTLGPIGKACAWVLYLFLFISLTVAYLSGGGELVATVLDVPAALGPTLFALLFAPLIWMGPWIVDRINRYFMVGLIASFLIFVAVGLRYVHPEQLKVHHWPSALFATPVVFTSFGFQGLVPTLTNYLGRDRAAVKKAIWIGISLPFVVYTVWQALILGLIPLEALEEAKRLGYSAVTPLKNVLGIPWIYRVGQAFAFFAIVTSFWGVGLAMLDFLADGLRVQKTAPNRFWLILLILVPPLAFATANPCIFLNALHYAGGLGSALLLGLLPILMMWVGKKRFPSNVPTWILAIMALFIVLELSLMGIKLIL